MSADSNGSSAGNSSVSRFFERPILNNPYEYPRRHWELDAEGQPTHRTLDGRRPAEFITPFPAAQQHGASSAQARLRIDRRPAGSGGGRQRVSYENSFTSGLVAERSRGCCEPHG